VNISKNLTGADVECR